MRVPSLIAVVLIAACGGDADDSDTRTAAGTRGEGSATAYASSFDQLSPGELEAGRLDAAWRRYADLDARERAATRGDPVAREGGADEEARRGGNAAPAGTDTAGASWEDITPRAVNAAPAGLPIEGDVAGPSVVRVQVLLDRVRFRPGAIDGRWGKNTEKAVYWFQNERGLEASGAVDRRTLERLEREAGLGDAVVVSHTLTDADVAGPFVDLPEDVYARAEEDCLCYESLREKLAEVFHAAPELLEQLNPDVDLNAASAGDALQIPNVEPFRVDELPDGSHTGGGSVARIAISDGGHYLHAMADDGTILYHFPTTLGSDYAPSPTGDFSVESITFDPTWHYQPELLTGEDPSRDDAVLPPGPNNAVGIVWMALSEPHYGIHGTGAPESIGYVTSNGCVRLTNWDAELLARNVAPDTPVSFRDVSGE